MFKLRKKFHSLNKLRLIFVKSKFGKLIKDVSLARLQWFLGKEDSIPGFIHKTTLKYIRYTATPSKSLPP